MSKQKNKIEVVDLVLIITIILLIIIILVFCINEILPFAEEDEQNNKVNTVVNEEEQENNETNTNETKVPQTEEEIIQYLSTLGERGRMEYYCGIYIKHLKHKEYEQAYNLLYSEFKENYFPTLEQYEEYVKNFYPEYFSLQYDDITRQGNIYVLRLKIIDALNSNKEDEENIQRIVIQEYNYNDFKLSFQVK